jgi:DNA modification methylase
LKPYYQDGLITIYHGDCLEVLPSLPSADLVMTDPPYGMGENNARNLSRGNRPLGGGRASTNSAVWAATDYGDFDWDKRPASQEEIAALLAAAPKAIIWGGNYFALPPSRAWLVWDKLNSGDFADGELAWSNLDQSLRIFRFLWNGMIRAGEMRGRKRVHPTQKPKELFAWCLKFVPEAGSVIDPFMGSGSSLRACKDAGVKCIGIEKVERYCEAAAERMAQEVLTF